MYNPFYEKYLSPFNTLSNRAFAKIRKYQFKAGRTLTNTNGVTIIAAKDKPDIPKEEKTKICEDLNKGYELSDRTNMIIDAIKGFANKFSQLRK